MDEHKPRSVRPDAIVPAQRRDLLPVGVKRSLPAVAAGATTVGLAWAVRRVARLIVKRAGTQAAAEEASAIEPAAEPDAPMQTDEAAPGDVIYRRVTIIEVRRLGKRGSSG